MFDVIIGSSLISIMRRKKKISVLMSLDRRSKSFPYSELVIAIEHQNHETVCAMSNVSGKRVEISNKSLIQTKYS